MTGWVRLCGIRACVVAVTATLLLSGCLVCPDADEVRELVQKHRDELAQIREWWLEDSQKGLSLVDMHQFGGPEARQKIRALQETVWADRRG